MSACAYPRGYPYCGNLPPPTKESLRHPSLRYRYPHHVPLKKIGGTKHTKKT
nr:MAG TPA: hypothetical protein [Caudoviricetes sp.]